MDPRRNMDPSLAKCLEDYRQLSTAQRDLVVHYADIEGLGSTKLRPQKREQLIGASLKDLKIRD